MTIISRAERIYSELEHRTDAAIHVLGVLFAINASLWLLRRVTGLPAAIGVFIYCAGLLAMISASAAYNLTSHGPSKAILRRLDHSAIFIMIAATYTPFAMNRLSQGTGSLILVAIWLCATLGVTTKLIFPGRFERESIIFYLI